jgi:hypothetical protein
MIAEADVGYIRHDMVLVSVDGYVFDRGWVRPELTAPDIDAFRASLPPEFRRLLVGPVHSAINNYMHWVFLPDGSKEGWDTSEEGDRYREMFIALFADKHYPDGSSPYDVAITKVRFGGDEPDAATVTPLLLRAEEADDAQ